MGYYDNSNQFQRVVIILITALVAAVIGGMFVLTLSPALVRAGILPQEYFVGRDAALSEEKGPEQTVSVNVNNDITEAVRKARPAVVGVVNYKQTQDPFSPEAVPQGTGSGIIFEKRRDRALVVTNYHVIQGANRVAVVIQPEKNNDPTEVEAKVLGGDKPTDLAVLEMDASHVKHVATFGNSDKLKAGEPAIAIGNPLGLEFSQSVTAGVISSPHRNFRIDETMSMDVIQTDAAINPGNSGGALINTAGQVIGINSLKIAQQGIEGLGFAIPVNDAKPIINDLIQHGEVRRAYLGIGLEDLVAIPRQAWETELNLPDSINYGSVVLQVEPGTGASKGDIKVRDVIVAVDGKKINNTSELRSYIWKEKSIGDEMKVTLYRNGKKQQKTITLQEE